MILTIDLASADPPYRQIWTQIVIAVVNGSLELDTRLPTIRQLAADLDIAPGTVARAYRELEAAGVIETRGRRGSFVKSPATDDSAVAIQRRAALDDAVRSCVEEGQRIGASPAEIVAALARALTAG